MVYRSNTSTSSLDASAVATLQWDAMALHTAGAVVSCDVISGRENMTYPFRIDTVSQISSLASSECAVESDITNFQFRVMKVFGNVCQHQNISSRYREQFQVVLMTVVETLCTVCGRVEVEEITVTSMSCSEEPQSVVFVGQVATAARDRTRRLVCALSEWQRSQPLVFLEESFHEVDPNCTIIPPLRTSLFTRDGHCSMASSPLTSAILISTVISAAMVMLVVVVLVVVTILISFSRKKKPSGTNGSTEKMEVNSIQFDKLQSINEDDKPPV